MSLCGKRNRGFFTCFTQLASQITGSVWGFCTAVGLIAVWALTGPLFGFSTTWQLLVNTGTTIVTFLMVFLIQSTQNRDTKAIHIKLAELIRATEGAHNIVLNLEELSEQELDSVRAKYEALAERAREQVRRRRSDTDQPMIMLYDEPVHVNKESCLT